MSAFDKIRWACRRGMLELDVLLGNFLNEAYEQLPEAEKALYVELLETSDPELNDWLLGRGVPPLCYQALVEKIRLHAKSRF